MNRWLQQGRGPLVVFIAVLACYARSLHGQFIWNDSEYVTSAALRSLAGLGRIWTQLGATEQYYPVLHTVFWLQHRAWGDHPLPYHLVTVLLHAAAAVLFARVLLRLQVCGAWLAALIFAVHPLHVESVAWITEQKNTLSLVLYLLAALAYLRFDDSRRPADYLTGLAWFVLSLACKTVTATLPGALLVVLWWRRGRLSWRRDFRPLVPWLAIGIAAGCFSSWVERHYVGAEGTDFAPSILGRFIVAGRAFWFYLGKLAWPFDLNFIYPRWSIDPGSAWQWAFLAGAVLLAVGLWALRRKSRSPLAALLFFAGSLFPVLGFVNLYGARYSFVWDHWQYLADLGPIALLSAALCEWGGHLAPSFRTAGAIVLGGLIALLGAMTWVHSGIFHDNEALYRATLARNPSCWLAENNLAFLLSKTPDRLTEAIEHYERALRVRPDYAEAEVNLGNALVGIPGRLDDAIAHYEHALRMRPDYAEACYNLANVLATLPDRKSEALLLYRRALQIRPLFAEACLNYADLLATYPDKIPEALANYEAALRIDPDLVEAHYNLAIQLSQILGRESDALAQYEAVLRLDPRHVAALNNLAVLYARQGKRAEAKRTWESALALDPSSVDIRRNLEVLERMSAPPR